MFVRLSLHPELTFGLAHEAGVPHLACIPKHQRERAGTVLDYALHSNCRFPLHADPVGGHDHHVGLDPW